MSNLPPNMLLTSSDALIERAVQQSGLEQKELLRRLRIAGGTTRSWLEQELATSDWVDRLENASRRHAMAMKERSADLLTKNMRTGLNGAPDGMVALTDANLEMLIPANLRKLAKEWKPENGGLLILGPTGIGKTAFGVAVGRRLIHEAFDRAEQKSREVGDPHFQGIAATHFFAWSRAIELGNARTQHKLGSGDAPAITDAKSPQTIVIDDLGWENQRDQVVPEVIAERYDRGRQTIVTSGQTWDELVTRYGEAVLRRVLESGGVKGRIVSLFKESRK